MGKSAHAQSPAVTLRESKNTQITSVSIRDKSNELGVTWKNCGCRNSAQGTGFHINNKGFTLKPLSWSTGFLSTFLSIFRDICYTMKNYLTLFEATNSQKGSERH